MSCECSKAPEVHGMRFAPGRHLAASCFLILLTLLPAHPGFAEGHPAAGEGVGKDRWDVHIIQERSVLGPMLEDYFAPEERRKAAWPSKREELEKVLAQHPDSEYADDVALVIAWGIASCEGDLEAALEAFAGTGDRYPEGETILLPHWIPHADLGFDEQWFYWAPTLVGNGIPFQGDGMHGVSSQEIEVLEYFNHFERYPRYTRDYVALSIAEIHWAKRQYDLAMDEWMAFCNTRFDQLVEFNKADREAAAKPYGRLIWGIERHAVSASMQLLRLSSIVDLGDDAVAVVDKIADATSYDGWYWQLNELLGDLHQEKVGEQPSKEALKQYTFALEGFLRGMTRGRDALEVYREDWQEDPLCSWRNSYTEPRGLWQRTISRLNKKIEAAGGQPWIDPDDFESLVNCYASAPNRPVIHVERERVVLEPVVLPWMLEKMAELTAQLTSAKADNDAEKLGKLATMRAGGGNELRENIEAIKREAADTLVETSEGRDMVLDLIVEDTRRGYLETALTNKAESDGLKGDPVVERLLGFLADGTPAPLRSFAVSLLGRAGDPRATEPLMALYRREENSEAREGIMSALGRLKDERALPLLEDAVKNDPASLVRLYARMAICLIEGIDYEIWKEQQAKQ